MLGASRSEALRTGGTYMYLSRAKRNCSLRFSSCLFARKTSKVRFGTSDSSPFSFSESFSASSPVTGGTVKRKVTCPGSVSTRFPSCINEPHCGSLSPSDLPSPQLRPVNSASSTIGCVGSLNDSIGNGTYRGFFVPKRTLVASMMFDFPALFFQRGRVTRFERRSRRQ